MNAEVLAKLEFREFEDRELDEHRANREMYLKGKGAMRARRRP